MPPGWAYYRSWLQGVPPAHLVHEFLDEDLHLAVVECGNERVVFSESLVGIGDVDLGGDQPDAKRCQDLTQMWHHAQTAPPAWRGRHQSPHLALERAALAARRPVDGVL